MKFVRLLAVAAAGFGLFAGAAAQAATIVGGNTRILVNQTLAGAPFSIATGVTGGATVVTASPLLVNISITGGDTAGPINHAGSGITLTRNSATVTLANFVINASGTVTGSLTRSNGTTTAGETLFTFLAGRFGDLTNPANFLSPSVNFNISSTLSAALLADLGLSALGLTDLTPLSIGVAASAPEVPLPAAAWMFLAGAGLLAARRRGALATV